MLPWIFVYEYMSLMMILYKSENYIFLFYIEPKIFIASQINWSMHISQYFTCDYGNVLL